MEGHRFEPDPEDDNVLVVKFHEDPAVDSLLKILNDKASFYRLAAGILTGKFDQNFAQWKVAQVIDHTPEAWKTVPTVDPLQEWAFTKATTNDLFLMQERLNALVQVLLTEIFGRYKEKDIRGMLPEGFGLLELSEARKDLVNVLNGTLDMAKRGMLPKVLADPKILEALPDVHARKPFGEGWQWDLPDAPSPDKGPNGPVTVTPGTNNYRSHNTTVKLIVDGVESTAGNLGNQVGALFPGRTVQDIGRMFEGWHTDYRGDGKTEPGKVLERDGKRFYFTIVG